MDKVFDRYDNPASIKAGVRRRRGSCPALEIKISSPSTPLPKQWDKYIANPCNKANLSDLLWESWSSTASERLATGQQLALGEGFKKGNDCELITRGQVVPVPVLESDHEEADTRLLLHAHHASSDHPRVTVQSPNTECAVICVHTNSG